MTCLVNLLSQVRAPYLWKEFSRPAVVDSVVIFTPSTLTLLFWSTMKQMSQDVGSDAKKAAEKAEEEKVKGLPSLGPRPKKKAAAEE